MPFGPAVLGLYVLLLAAHAVGGARRNVDVTEFHVAGRRLGGGLVGLSFFATFLSTNSFVGLTGRSARFGLGTWFIGGAFVLFAWLSWSFVAPRVRRLSEEFGALSLPELFGRVYQAPLLRRALALVIVVASLPYLQAVYKGQALVVASMTGWSLPLSLALGWAVVLAYTLLGGFHAVARTDALQALFMLAAAVGLPLALVRHAGGFEPLLERTAHAVGVPPGQWFGLAPPGVLVAYGLAGGLKLLTEPRQVSRFFAVAPAEMRRARRCAVLALLTAYAFLLPVGLLAAGVLESVPDDADRIVPTLLAAPGILPPLLGALTLGALLAAGMSSLDSVLLVLGAVVERDLLGGGGRRGELRRTRLWILALSAPPAAAVLWVPAEILDLTTVAGGLFGAALLAPLLGLFADRRRPRRAVLLGSTLGVLVFCGWRPLALALPALGGVHEVTAGAIAATLPPLAALAARPFQR